MESVFYFSFERDWKIICKLGQIQYIILVKPHLFSFLVKNKCSYFQTFWLKATFACIIYPNCQPLPPPTCRQYWIIWNKTKYLICGKDFKWIKLNLGVLLCTSNIACCMLLAEYWLMWFHQHCFQVARKNCHPGASVFCLNYEENHQAVVWMCRRITRCLRKYCCLSHLAAFVLSVPQTRMCGHVLFFLLCTRCPPLLYFTFKMKFLMVHSWSLLLVQQLMPDEDLVFCVHSEPWLPFLLLSAHTEKRD